MSLQGSPAAGGPYVPGSSGGALGQVMEPAMGLHAPRHGDHKKNFALGVLKALFSERKARSGVIILLVFVLVAIFAPVLSPYSPTSTNFARSASMNWAHPLGTTGSGQDALSQLLYGTRISLVVGLAAGAFATATAVAIGVLAGYLRGVVEETLGFIANLFLVIPTLPLMIVLAAYLPSRGVGTILFVVSITGWAWGSRIMRSQTATLRSRDFVAAARLSGESVPRIVFREIMPNMVSLIAANYFAAATAAVLAEAGLEFLGLGNPSTISWGTMLFWAENTNALLTGQWALLFAPGLCIALLATSFSLINFGIDALGNPRLREGK